MAVLGADTGLAQVTFIILEFSYVCKQDGLFFSKGAGGKMSCLHSLKTLYLLHYYTYCTLIDLESWQGKRESPYKFVCIILECTEIK